MDLTHLKESSQSNSDLPHFLRLMLWGCFQKDNSLNEKWVHT